MPRAPRASVSKTSGQGISRLSYQKGYALKGGAASGLSAKFSSGGGDRRDYAKKGGSTPKPQQAEGINISYGDTYEPTDLGDIEALGERAVPKTTVGAKHQGAKKWKGG
jgi:hypothetical protein